MPVLLPSRYSSTQTTQFCHLSIEGGLINKVGSDRWTQFGILLPMLDYAVIHQ